MRDLKDETQLLEGAKQLPKSCRCRWVSEKSRKSIKVQLSETKERKKVQLQALNSGTKGLGKLVGEGRPNWEKGVAGKLAMRRRMMVGAD